MKILVGCEESQEVCKAFRKLGHEAYSCDIQECSGGHPEWHIQGDAIKALYSQKWGLVIAHPPCDRLANSGVRWLVSKKPRQGYSWNKKYQNYTNDDDNMWNNLYEATQFFNAFVIYGRAGNKIAIENPIPHKYAKEYVIDNYSQIIQPYQFGNLEKKATCLWLYGVPELKETKNVYNEMMALDYEDRAKIHNCPPGPDRKRIRSKTYPGIAKAMAEQWGGVL